MSIDEYLELVKDALELLPELKGIGVVVDQQQDVDKVKDHYIQKCKGYCVTIGEVSNRNGRKEMDGPVMALKFGVTVYSPKIVPCGETTGATLRDVIVRRLNLSKLQTVKHCYHEAVYDKGDIYIEKKGTSARMVHAMSFDTQVNYARHPELES